MKYIDLHVHSNASDGSLSPSEVVDRAVKQSLAAFALTDHDTLHGISEAKARAEWHTKNGTPIELIPGVEISAGYKNRDIHILGLMVDEYNDVLNLSLEKARENRETRNERMLERFASLGIILTMDELRADAPDTVITRAHFANVLMKKGIVATNTEAFDKYLNHNAPCYVPRAYMTPEQAIALIRKANGIPVLAHPLLYGLPADELYTLIQRLKESGLLGLEVLYSSNYGSDEATLRGLSSHFSLQMTGGSDFHGALKPTIELGTGKGNLHIPYSILEHLRELR